MAPMMRGRWRWLLLIGLLLAGCGTAQDPIRIVPPSPSAATAPAPPAPATPLAAPQSPMPGTTSVRPATELPLWAESPLPTAPPPVRKTARTGMTVEHPKYGTGTVVRREGEGEDAKITVNFPRFGLKKLIEKYAGLKRS